MALKIGLNLAVPPPPPPLATTSIPTKDTSNSSEATTTAKNNKKKKRSRKDRPPDISWGRDMEDFFWPPNQEETVKYSSACDDNSNDLTPKFIPNTQSFPLIHLRQVLSPENLAWAVPQSSIPIKGSASLPGGIEEIEQHEQIVGTGKVRTVRRSIVSQLDSQGELLARILSNLPKELVAGTSGSSSNNIPHPYEDGSTVYYRTGQVDFYEEHHDSYDSGETNRDRQRAFTVLLYLRTPPGPLENGGTEFTQLTLDNSDLDNNHQRPFCAASENIKGNGKGIVVKPSAGDALVWPNFDRNGTPYGDSVHRALPVAGAEPPPNRQRHNKGSISNVIGIGKVVMNIWFEGFDKRQ